MHQTVALPARVSTPCDLRAVLRAAGYRPGGSRRTVAPAARRYWPGPVTVNTGPAGAVDPALACDVAHADGTQASLVIRHRYGRPVTLQWAAAAVTHTDRPVAIEERLWIACAYLDADWANLLPDAPPVVASPYHYPSDLAADTARHLAAIRVRLEQDVVTQAALPDNTLLIVDGSLIGHVRPHGSVAGVIKTVRTRYLPDERPIEALDAGEHTARFVIHGRTEGEPDRHSTYLRLHRLAGDPLAGVVRVETHDPALLPAALATAWQQRQDRGSGDPRWDRHLAGIALTERLLRARRPDIYTVDP